MDNKVRFFTFDVKTQKWIIASFDFKESNNSDIYLIEIDRKHEFTLYRVGYSYRYSKSYDPDDIYNCPLIYAIYNNQTNSILARCNLLPHGLLGLGFYPITVDNFEFAIPYKPNISRYRLIKTMCHGISKYLNFDINALDTFPFKINSY